MTLRYRGWQEHALCDGMDPAIFFPERGESNARAKRICARCPVRGECLVTAIHDEPTGKSERHGTAGGLTANERDRFAKKYRVDSQRPPMPTLVEADA